MSNPQYHSIVSGTIIISTGLSRIFLEIITKEPELHLDGGEVKASPFMLSKVVNGGV
jgi:hypothetical protein